MDILTAVRKAILVNELDNAAQFAYRFSRAVGGTSGYSFGICQLDVSNNPAAVLCLRECEFTTDEITSLKEFHANLDPLNLKLRINSAIVDKWDDKQIHECITHVQFLLDQSQIKLENDETFVHCADYHNQFYMSKGGKFHTFLRNLGRPVGANDVLRFKLSLPWGQKRPDDVKRRWNNIAKLMRG